MNTDVPNLVKVARDHLWQTFGIDASNHAYNVEFPAYGIVNVHFNSTGPGMITVEMRSNWEGQILEKIVTLEVSE